MKKTLPLVIILNFLFLSSCTYLGLGSDSGSIKANKSIEKLRQEEIELHPFPIIQGLTTEDQTQIKVIIKKDNRVEFKFFQNENEIKTFTVQTLPAGETEYVIHQIEVTNLTKDTNYTLQVLKNQTILDQRNFQTVDLSLEKPKIGIVSCLNDKYLDLQFSMWSDYLTQNPTYTFMIGDNVYADTLISSEGKVYTFKHATETTLWRRYIQTFNTLSYYRASRLTPTLAIWDDHDYGYNNGDESYPYKKESLKVFEAFYGVKLPVNSVNSTAKTPLIEKLSGAGYIFNAFNQKFIFIDGRSFRSEPIQKGKVKESHLGKDQTAKILKSLSPSTLAWLIKGDQFFGGYHAFESFESNHPNDFKIFISEIKKRNAKVFFVSGDRHLNEFMKIPDSELGYESYELTSSALHASVYPDAWKTKPNPRQMDGVSGVENYSIVEIQNSKPWEMKVTSFGPKMKLLYERKVSITTKN